MRSSNSDTGSEILSGVVYSTLHAVIIGAQMCPLPEIGTAAQLVVEIWDKVKTIRSNELQFKKLARAAGDIIEAIWSEINRQVNEHGVDISDSFKKSFEEFHSVLESIRRLVVDYTRRKFLRRFFCSSSDRVRITKYQQELKEANEKFQLVNTVAVRATVERIENRAQRSLSTQPPSTRMTMSNTGSGAVNNADKVDNRKGITADSVSNFGSITIGDGRDTFHGNVYNESNSNHGNGTLNNVRGNQSLSGEPNGFNSNATPWSPGH